MNLNLENIDNDLLDNCFEKRQNLIDKIDDDKELNYFREFYKDKEIYKIDEEIKNLLKMQILDTKKEIAQYKKNQIGNFAYANTNKVNLNIFSKKV